MKDSLYLLLAYFFGSLVCYTAGYYSSERTELREKIILCEKDLPRTKSCLLIAVPKE